MPKGEIVGVTVGGILIWIWISFGQECETVESRSKDRSIWRYGGGVAEY